MEVKIFNCEKNKNKFSRKKIENFGRVNDVAVTDIYSQTPFSVQCELTYIRSLKLHLVLFVPLFFYKFTLTIGVCGSGFMNMQNAPSRDRTAPLFTQLKPRSSLRR